MRKIRRRVIYKISIVAVISVVGLVFLFSGRSELDRNTEILIIERSIRSATNEGGCRMPELPLYNPEIMKFYTDNEKIDCSGGVDWVMCEKSICFVKPEISASHGDVKCSYTDIIRTTDYSATYGKTTKTKEPYILRDSDFVKVICRAESGQSWKGMAYGIRDGVAVQMERRPQKLPPNVPFISNDDAMNNPPFNILILGFDSLSRNAFMRKLPKTYKYLIQQLDAIVLKGYNIVGDGTPQALVPLLTGYTELELPDTRKGIKHSVNVDIYPMIWKEYARHGYYTSFNEDLPNVGTFTYRLNGFLKQPVDHYLRTFYVESLNNWRHSNEHCLGHTADHMVMLEYTKNFMAKYKESPRFVFSFHGGLSHDSINLIGAADDDLINWLRALNGKHLLDNTILIMMADHGNRFADVRATLQGKQEERLPFFSFSFPKTFRERFQHEYETFVNNSKRLITPFDIHATLQHILTLQKPFDLINSDEEQQQTIHSTSKTLSQAPVSLNSQKLAEKRAISLFEHIPKNRSCGDAYIEPHWCACLQWQRLDLNGTDAPLLLKLSASIVTTINNYTRSYRMLCAQLELQQINWALRVKPNQQLLRFKSSASADGFIPNMSDNMNVTEEIYQLQIVVNPGQSLFEASVTYNLQTFTAHTRLSDISRVNKYGKQADCIYNVNPELRKYCYCRA